MSLSYFHDDRCATWKGHPCNCSMAVFEGSPTGRAPSEPEEQRLPFKMDGIAETMQKLYDSHDLSQMVIITLGANAGMRSYERHMRELEAAARRGESVVLPMECSLTDAEARIASIMGVTDLMLGIDRPLHADELKAIKLRRVEIDHCDIPEVEVERLPPRVQTHPTSPKETMRGNRNKRRKHRRR